MKVLLDTHALIWYAEGVDKLSVTAKSEIDNSNNKLVSTASLWEIVIKSSSNKIELKQSFKEINRFLFNNDIQILPVNVSHLTTLLTLPHHHKDPFDRLVIAQAITENLIVLSKDRQFISYPVNVIW